MQRRAGDVLPVLACAVVALIAAAGAIAAASQSGVG
jgi:hypothetical protein